MTSPKICQSGVAAGVSIRTYLLALVCSPPTGHTQETLVEMTWDPVAFIHKVNFKHPFKQKFSKHKSWPREHQCPLERLQHDN